MQFFMKTDVKKNNHTFQKKVISFGRKKYYSLLPMKIKKKYTIACKVNGHFLLMMTVKQYKS